ncbi:hypothetical protein TNCV_1132381 [Trichonephila clavipes]|nr:hypothetical protein TNCV_1132381 [Trichonephila clavipes]
MSVFRHIIIGTKLDLGFITESNSTPVHEVLSRMCPTQHLTPLAVRNSQRNRLSDLSSCSLSCLSMVVAVIGVRVTPLIFLSLYEPIRGCRRRLEDHSVLAFCHPSQSTSTFLML